LGEFESVFRKEIFGILIIVSKCYVNQTDEVKIKTAPRVPWVSVPHTLKVAQLTLEWIHLSWLQSVRHFLSAISSLDLST